MEPFAIIHAGNDSKQYRVQAGDLIDIELIDTEEKGSIKFEDVLLLNDGNEAKVGTPTVEGAIVAGEVLGRVRGPKVFSYRYKKRKNYHKKVGHRQDYYRVKITEIYTS